MIFRCFFLPGVLFFPDKPPQRSTSQRTYPLKLFHQALRRGQQTRENETCALLTKKNIKDIFLEVFFMFKNTLFNFQLLGFLKLLGNCTASSGV